MEKLREAINRQRRSRGSLNLQIQDSSQIEYCSVRSFFFHFYLSLLHDVIFISHCNFLVDAVLFGAADGLATVSQYHACLCWCCDKYYY